MNKLTISQVFDIAAKSTKTKPYENKPNTPQWPAIIYYRFHRELIKAIQPKVVVELGVAAGGTSLHMCIGSPKSKVIGVDITREKWDKHIAHIEKNHSNYEFWKMDTVAAAKKMWLRYEKPVIGHLYVDALHEKEQVFQELRAYKRLMLDGAVVIFDDLYLTDDMAEMWEELPFTEKVRLDYLHVEVGYGCAIWRNSEIRGW